MRKKELKTVCPVCGREQRSDQMIPGAMVRANVAEEIRKDHPAWTADDPVCAEDLNHYRNLSMVTMLAREKGELTQLEEDVLESLRTNETLARDVDAHFEEKLTLGQRAADRLASFGGSWRFILLFACILVLWLAVNTFAILAKPFDPYPYILLNLVLSCIAALQAPVIMMSQNRQEAKDRLRSQQDYRINLKAELEIRHLHEKIDHLLMRQWERLVEIQEIQIDLMEEILRERKGR
ncbi:MAG TPA: DUF1003 domain-containing protein [Geobacteraceae bacterium]